MALSDGADKTGLMEEIKYSDILALKNQELQQMKDERDEMLEMLLDLVKGDDYFEHLCHIDHARNYLEQLKKKR